MAARQPRRRPNEGGRDQVTADGVEEWRSYALDFDYVTEPIVNSLAPQSAPHQAMAGALFSRAAAPPTLHP